MAVMAAPKLENDQDLKIHAITMVRNEADIILPFLNQVAALFDKFVIVDVQSTDGTLETIKSFSEFWPNIGLYSLDIQEKHQAAMMTMLAANAFHDGADWVFCLDGDEFINVSSKKELHNYLRAFRYDVMHMPWINMVPSRYGRFESFDISQEFYWSGRVSPFKKIAVASLFAATNPNFYIHEGSHWVTRDINESPDPENLNLGLTLLHLPVRSAERLKYRAFNALRLLRSKHNTIQGEGYHVERILKLIDKGLASSGGMNVIASNYSGNDDTIESLDPKELDWPSKKLPDYVVKPGSFATFSSALRDTLLKDAKLVWRKPNFVKGSAVKAEIAGNKVRILPQPMSGEGGMIRGRYEKLNADNPAIPTALTVDLLIESVAVSFLKIRSVTFSGWSELIPALFCMFSVLRPRRFVELGVGDGTSFFAGCQVVEFLGLDTRCVAIDSWTGDSHAGSHSRDVFEQFRATMKELYPSQHHVQAYSKHASQCFDEESIDLLHMNGYDLYEVVRDDFETWLRKMSQIGVIMVHNINAYGEGLGVWRFWEELKERYPTFSLLHCHGLGILYAGVQSNSILDLFALLKNNQAYATLVQEYLRSLGILAIGRGESLELHDDRELLGLGTKPGLANEAIALSRRLLFNAGALLKLQTVAEQKKTYKIIKESGLFDADYYLSSYDDVRTSGLDPIAHFVYYGASELRNPNAFFNTAAYLLKNADVMRAGTNPFEHYIVAGKREKRSW